MTDKSSVDNTNRNTVRNPLLSTAVVGLSIEDLTHNAILLPAAQNSALICSQETSTMHPAPARVSENTDRTDSTDNPPKTDDFDVNEYIARLQGSRYVSAPINATLDTNMNATEDNLEEINLNEQVEEQSITADIAQNFSQLPAVLPQVASAVFSSLSNMMRVKREGTPEVVDGYQADQFESQTIESKPFESQKTFESQPFESVPFGGKVEERPPPLKEPPVGSTGSTYRMTTKKKTYAQIPGLSNNSAVFMQGAAPQANAESISYFTPNLNPGTQTNIPQPIQTDVQTRPPVLNPSVPYVQASLPISTRNVAPPTSIPMFPSSEPSQNPWQSSSSLTYGNVTPNQTFSLQNQTNSMFPPNSSENTPPVLNPMASINQMPQASIPQSIKESRPPVQNPGVPPIIPPPTMFSNAPRRDSKSDVEKTILPPSVARRLASQPVIIAPPSLPKFEANIFVPAPIVNEDVNTANVAPPPMFNCPTAPASATAKIEEKTAISMFDPSQVAANPIANITPSNVPSFDPTEAAQNAPSLPPPPTFFTPPSMPAPSEAFIAPKPDINQSIFNASITQPNLITTNYPEPPKAVPEPPKMGTGNLNYRMTKKRPQYYLGPIEGVGSISNNVKPVIAPINQGTLTPAVNPDSFQGQLFTPPEVKETIPYQAPLETPSVPFDMSRPMEPVQNYSFPTQSTQVEASWDISRQTTNNFEPPKQESSAFGLIGSLKSKLSSLDINKIQNKVTTFFDPAYNEAKEGQSYPEYPTQVQTAQSNLNLFDVPHQYGQTYGQDYNTTQQQNYYNYPQNQCYQQDYQNQPQAPYYQADFQNTNASYSQQSLFPQSHEQIPSVNPYQTVPQNTDQSFVIGSQCQSQDGASSMYQQTEKVEPIPQVMETDLNNDLLNHQPAPLFANVPKETFYDTQAKDPSNDDAEIIDEEVIKTKPTLPPIGVPIVPTLSGQTGKSFFDQPTIETVHNPSKIPKDYSLDNTRRTEIGSIGENLKTETHNAFNINILSLPAESFFDIHQPVKSIPDAFKSEPKPEVKSIELKKDGLKSPEKLPLGISPSGFFVKCLEPDVTAANFFDNPQASIGQNEASIQLFSQDQYPMPIEKLLQEKIPLSSLPGEVIESIATSSVIRDIAKELVRERRVSFSERRESNVGFVPYKPTEIGASKETDKNGIPLVENAVHVFTENQSFKDNGNEMFFMQRNVSENYHEHESDINICETCREVNQPEEEASDLTKKLIENITSPIQLSNPVEVPLTEFNEPIEDTTDMSNNVCAEITHITEETIETLQVQAATELLDDDIIDNFEKNLKIATDLSQAPNFGWSNPTEQHDYSFQPDPNAIGFYGKNSLFFDDIPKNASDEIKAEFKSAHEESPTNILTRQMSVPTAPPAEEIDDNKSDGTGLDVISIEQDASKDFHYEDYVIEPSETDDDKVHKDKDKTSDEPSPDSFTNRVEKYQLEAENDAQEKMVGSIFDSIPTPALTMASFFDTGNYAAETHYQKSLTSPQGSLVGSPPNQSQPTMSVLSPMPQYSTLANLIAQNEDPFENKLPEIPSEIPTYSSQSDLFNVVTQFPDIIKDMKMCGDGSQKTGMPVIGEKVEDSVSIGDTKVMEVFPRESLDTVNKAVETLSDPMDFFASSKTEEKPAQSEDGFNRLASYFSSPKNTDQSKPFFELSEGQDHLRKDVTKPDESQSFFDLSQSQNHLKKTDIPVDLMRDLTSVNNYIPNQDQLVRHVNYFTVHYDNVELNKVTKEPKGIFRDNKVKEEFIDSKVDMKKQEVKVKKAMDGGNEGKGASPTQKESPSKQMNVTFNLSIEDDKEDNQVLIASDGRAAGEYTPVKHHWFYRVDCEGRSIWKGFSVLDSNALEDAFHSPTLSEQTLVATDGGRYDVNVVGRLRIPVYWPEKPTNVKRCSWFSKGTTDARYVPYDEDVAERLEEEYKNGVTMGIWHRRLSLPNNEAVILHTPAVMVHVLQPPAADAWAGTRTLLWSKKVYRNPLKIKYRKDQDQKVDHLLLLVHGAGEWRHQKKKLQSTMRPRVVRRSHDESEIEDVEPSRIDHLLLLCHGVGSACDMRFRNVEEVVDDFRATSLQLIQGHYKNAYDSGEIGRVEVLPVSWHATLHAGERGVDRRLSRITLSSIPRIRAFTNESVLDILFYTSPAYCQTIIDTVCSEVNRIYKLFKIRNPNFQGGVSLGGHSLGSVILYDLLCHQSPETPIHPGSHCNKKLVSLGAAGQPTVKYPTLDFAPEALYALGSPIAMFECTRGVESLGEQFALPTCRRFFNIFHPYDPIAYRVEPLINLDLKDVSPFLIPHHKGRKRMHLELKETMARVGADIKQKLFESIKATWSSMWRTQPPTSEQMEKVVEEEIEKEELEQEAKLEQPQDLDQKTLEKLGKLNGGRRIDYVLQEAPFEMINEYLFAISSHVGYWESEDTMLLMLREIYDSLGVRPDGSVPQRTMTVSREDEDDNDASERPSTSHSLT